MLEITLSNSWKSSGSMGGERNYNRFLSHCPSNCFIWNTISRSSSPLRLSPAPFLPWGHSHSSFRPSAPPFSIRQPPRPPLRSAASFCSIWWTWERNRQKADSNLLLNHQNSRPMHNQRLCMGLFFVCRKKSCLSSRRLIWQTLFKDASETLLEGFNRNVDIIRKSTNKKSRRTLRNA